MCVWSCERGVSGLGPTCPLLDPFLTPLNINNNITWRIFWRCYAIWWEEKAQGGPKFGQYRPSAWFFHGTEQPRVTTSSQVPPLPHRVTDGFSLSPMLYQSTFPTSMQCVFFSFLLYDDALHISHVATTRRFQNLELVY